MITLSVCLSDIPKDRITEGKNGKKYINLVLDERKDEGKFGETHMLYISQSKEERQEKAKRTYVGGGKEWKFEKKEYSNSSTSDKDERLPF